MNEEEAIKKIKWSIQINNATKEINGDSTSINVQVLETVLNLLEKKDKIIDEMAYDIATNDSDLCQYIDETIRCKKYAGENKLTCDECIKQYFERKVENGN